MARIVKYKLMISDSKTAVGFLLLLLLLAYNNGAAQNHPYLILTKEKINILNSNTDTVSANLRAMVLRTADDFCKLELPLFENADNKYRYIGETMPALGLAYQLTSRKKYLDAAINILEAILAVKEWSGDDNLGRSAWISGSVLLYDWLYDSLPGNLKERIQKRMFAEANVIMNTASKYRALSNHLLIETTSLGLIGLVFKNETNKAETLLNQADGWANYIISHAPLDGSWGEGIQYWGYGLGYFLQFLESAKTSNYHNYYKEYSWLKETGYFPIYFALPGRYNEVINFSDCSSKRNISPFLLFLPASVYKNEYFQDYGLKLIKKEPHKYSWMDLLCFDKSISSKDIRTLPTFKHFEDNGFVTMRNNWSDTATIIGFRCGPAPGHANQTHPDRAKMHGFGPGHGHPDINSFNIYSHGEWLAIDPGYTYKKETRNHNTIMSNGAGQSGAGGKWLDYMAFEGKTPVPKIIKAESNNYYDYVIGDAGNIYKSEAEINNFKRHILFLKPNIIVVYDVVDTKIPSSVDWILNTISPIKKVENENSFLVDGSNVHLLVQPIETNAYIGVISERCLRASDINNLKGVKKGTMNALMLKFKNISKLRSIVVLSIHAIDTKMFKIEYASNELKIFEGGKIWNLKIPTDDGQIIISK